MITHIAFSGYPCRDVAATRAWYEANLGLHFVGPYVEDGVERYNEVHLGDTAFSLVWWEWNGRAAGTGAGVVFEVDDLDATLRSLSERSVATEPITETPVCRMSVVHDPEGNRIGLHQQKRG